MFFKLSGVMTGPISERKEELAKGVPIRS